MDNKDSYKKGNKDQSEAEKVRAKLDDISQARRRRSDVARDYRWKELIEECRGKWELADGGMDISILPINLIFAYLKTEIPSLYIRDPHIKVNPKNKTSIATAKVLEEVINYVWRYKKLKRETKKCIVDAILIGHSWMKVGYTGRFGTIEENGVSRETVEDEDIFAYHIDWQDITFDQDAMDPPYDCKWISHSVWLNKSDVENNPRYKNTDLLQEGSVDINDNNYMDLEGRPQSKKNKVRLEEVWDIENRTVCTVSDGVDKYIEDPKEWPLDMRGFPFSILKFNFSNDMAYGISDVAMFEPQILELIKVRSQSLDHIKRYNRQLLTTPQNISDDEMEKLAQAITGSVIECGDPDKVKPVPYPPLPSDIYAIEERLKEDTINVSGQSPTERGASQKTSTRTMGELNKMSEGAANRRSEKVDLVEDFVEEVSGKLISLLKQFVTEPYYIRILGINSDILQQAVKERRSSQGPEAVTNESGFTFTSEDIEGEFDVEPVAGSSTPLNKAELMKTLLSLVELGPKAGALPGGPFMGTIAKLIAENLDIEELDVALKQEQEMQQANKKEQAEKAEEMRQLALSEKGAEAQMDAENVATKQNKVMADFIANMKKTEVAEKKAKDDVELDQIKASNEIENERRKAEMELELESAKLAHQMKLEEIKLQHDIEIDRLKTEAEIKNMKKKEKSKPAKEGK